MNTLTYGLIDADLPATPPGALSPAELMKLAAGGLYSKSTLASLLNSEGRGEFLAACAAIEKQLTEECAAERDFCIGSECAAEGDACLEAVLKAGPRYGRAIAAQWIPIFRNPANRIAG